jgi:hypothetical protein
MTHGSKVVWKLPFVNSGLGSPAFYHIKMPGEKPVMRDGVKGIRTPSNEQAT